MYTKRSQPACALASALLGVSLGASNAARAAGDPLVEDVVTQFSQLQLHGDPIGVNLGVGVDPDNCRHYQGVVHMQAAGIPYLFLTRSGYLGSGFCGTSNQAAELCVARLGSRGTGGERMRSNKLQRDTSFQDTQPPPSDRIVVSRLFAGQGGWPAWTHAGGTQMIDGVLPVPLERPFDDPSAEDRGTICFVDVSNPEMPLVMKTLPEFDFNIGVLAVSKDPQTGTYLFLLTGGDSETLYFYESNTTDLRDPGLDLTLVGVWFKPQASQTTQNKWMAWQSMNFVRQTDGTLYLLCTDNSTPTLTDGDDWARLFSFTRSGTLFTITYVAERHLKLNDPKMGDLDASAGVYVSPSGQLILYTGEHDNDGAGGSIRMGEFRNYNMDTTNGDDCRGWVTLYEDTSGWHASAKSFTLDFVDRDKEDWNDLDQLEGFGGQASSVRWAIPVGRSAALYTADNYGGSVYFLTGTGQVESIANLDTVGMHDAVHSIQFLGNLDSALEEVYVGPVTGGPACPMSGDGSAACPYWGDSSISTAVNELGEGPCYPDNKLFLYAASYNQSLTIDKPVTLYPLSGPATIGAN